MEERRGKVCYASKKKWRLQTAETGDSCSRQNNNISITTGQTSQTVNKDIEEPAATPAQMENPTVFQAEALMVLQAETPPLDSGVATFWKEP